MFQRRRVMLVAHPDDETLFGAGLILRFPGDWTVIACSIPPADPIRAYKFFTACDRLNVKGRLVPSMEPPQPDAVDLSEFDCIVTHGPEGEYGHKHHQFMFEWSMQKDLPVVSFSGESGFILTEEEVDARLHALKAYDHQSPSDAKPKWEALIDRYNPGSVQRYQIWR